MNEIKKYQKQIAIAVGVILLAVVLMFVLKGRKGNDADQYTRPLGECEIREGTFKVADDFMLPKYKKGDEVDVTYGHYPCHKVEKGDYVIYRKSQLVEPVLRIVKGVAGDEYKLIKTKTNQWNIEINGDVYEVDGKEYAFGSDNPPVLSLSEKATKGLLGPTHVLIFSQVSPGYDDSGTVGVISSTDLLGKVH